MGKQSKHDELLEAAQRGLRDAAREAIMRGKETDTPVYVWEDEESVNLLADPSDQGPNASNQSKLTRLMEELED